MDREQIIRMAREVADKDKVDPYLNEFVVLTPEELERFAGLVADAERDQARELLERCETEMRYAGWTKYEPDNFARHEVYEEVKEFLARGNT